MKKSELKKHIIEALTPQEADKVDSKYKEIYGGMLKGNKRKLMKYIDPESGRPNPDKVAYGRAIKLIQKESANLKEKELTAAEKRKKEDIIMSLKKQKGGKDKLEPADYAIATSRAKKLAEITGDTRKMEDLLSKILRAINNVDKSQDDTEDDVEELDKSIDYLSAALTDKDPLDIAIDQSTFGRLAKPANEEKTLEQIDAIMEESAYDKGRLEKKVKSILKKEGGAVGLKPLVDAAKELGASKKDLMDILKKMKDVKTHKDGDIIDTGGLNETGMDKAKKNMDMYKDKNRLTELIKAALMGPISEKKQRPDYPDIDGDGDTEEPMVKAAKDKEKAEANESFDSLVKKVDKAKGYTKKEAEKVAGAIAAKKMKGAGKGPTAKQKARMAETILKELRGNLAGISEIEMTTPNNPKLKDKDGKEIKQHDELEVDATENTPEKYISTLKKLGYNVDMDWYNSQKK